MDRKRIREIVKRPGMIAGIYNYCDRWCERCTMTAHCSVFAMERDELRGTDSMDLQNRKFWDHLGDCLSNAREMIEEWAGENDVDLDEELPAEWEEQEEALEQKTRNHPLQMGARDYMDAARSWFESADALFEARKDELVSLARMELPGADPAADARELGDCIDVLRWYESLIYVKIGRAVRGKLEGVPEIIADMPRDCDGSAKVALIGMDRSIAAWMLMQDHFPQRRDEILDKLIQLDRLRKATEKFFPEARPFVRPGFDEPPP